MFCFSVLASNHILGLPSLSTSFFQGLHQLHWANFLRQEADYLWLEADCLEAEGLQQIEFAIAGLEAEGLYILLQEAMIQPDLSASVGPPLPKRHKWAATAMVLGPTVQDHGHRPSGSQAQGRHVRADALLYPSLYLRRQQYQLEWNLCKLTWVIPNESTTVRLRDVQRDL